MIYIMFTILKIRLNVQEAGRGPMKDLNQLQRRRFMSP